MSEVTDTTAATAEATAATVTAENSQQAGAEATASTAEQQTAFQKFVASLFGGKGKEDAAPDGGAGKTEPEGAAVKAYTEADLQVKLEEAKAAWAADQAEQARLAKLSPEERAKAESDAKDKELAEVKAQLLQRDLKAAAVAKLDKEGLPVELADLLTYTDQASMEKSLERLQSAFRASVTTTVTEKLRGKTPEGLGGAANGENAIRDQIAKSVRGGI